MTPGPIQRIGTFLYQLDDGSLDGKPVNLWSGNIRPNNCYSPEYVEKAARLFVAAPSLYEALRDLLSKASPHDPHKNRSNEGRWVTINAPRELVESARAALAAANGEGDGNG